MSQSPFLRVLGVLWAMLNQRQRVVFSVLVVFLLVAGIFEMGGMLVIFGFISGLKVETGTGERGGRLAKVLELVHGSSMDQREYVLIVGGLVLFVLVVKNAIGLFAHFALTRFLMKLNQRVSESLYAGHLLLPYQKLMERGALSLGGQISRIFDVFSRSFTAIAQILADGLMLLMVVGVLLFINTGLTIASAVLFGGVGALSYFVVQRRATLMSKQEKASRLIRSQNLSDGLRGLIDVRLRDAREVMLKNYSKALQVSVLLRRRSQFLERLPRSTNEITLALTIVGAVAFLAYRDLSIHDAFPTLAIFGFAGLRMTAAMSRVNRSMQRLKRNANDFETYYQSILEVAPHTFVQAEPLGQGDYLHSELKPGEGRRPTFRHSIQLKNVSFSFQKTAAFTIRDLSVKVSKGEFVSFCGPSGGGKSTIVLLLMGLLEPQRGEVRCDELNVFHHIRRYHGMIGYVGQDMYFSKRTIRENVAFPLGPSEIDDERVWQVLELAAAAKFVRKLTKKARYKLTEGAANLSGGQRQRLAIARALYHDPDILVLDEATAALDNTTEREIAAALQSLVKTKTIICIAHRLSTIRASDVIHVVDKGRISASGSYDELIDSSSVFRSLADEQADAEGESESSIH